MNETHRSRWIPALLIAALCTAVNAFQWLYTDVDNYMIAMVTNGLLGPDGYAPQLNPILCWIVQLVSLGFPTADAYLLTVKTVVFIGYWWAAYRILNAPKRKRFLGWMVLLLICLMCPPQMHYTVLAGLLAATGWMGILYGARNGRWGNLVPSMLLLFFGGLFSWQAAALTLPVMLFWILPELFSPAKGRTFRTFLSSLTAMAAAAAVIAALAFFKIQIVDLYNTDARAILAASDAQWVQYEALPGTPSFDKTDYDLVRSGFLADPENITPDLVGQMAEAGTVKSESTWEAAALRMAEEPLKEIRSTAVLFFCGVLLLVLMCTKHSAAAKIGILGAYAGTYALGTWLAYTGRLGENTCLILMLCLLYFHLMALIWGTQDTDGMWEVASFRNKLPLRRMIRTAAVLTMLVVMLLGSLTWIFDGPMQMQLAWNARVQQDLSFYHAADSDQYLWNPADYVRIFLKNGFMKEGTLPSEPFLYRNIPAGGWLYSCGAMQEYLKRIQTENPTRKLLESETMHLVSSSASDVQNFIQKHYDISYSLLETDRLYGLTVFTVPQNGKK